MSNAQSLDTAPLSDDPYAMASQLLTRLSAGVMVEVYTKAVHVADAVAAGGSGGECLARPGAGASGTWNAEQLPPTGVSAESLVSAHQVTCDLLGGCSGQCPVLLGLVYCTVRGHHPQDWSTAADIPRRKLRPSQQRAPSTEYPLSDEHVGFLSAKHADWVERDILVVAPLPGCRLPPENDVTTLLVCELRI